MKNLSRLFRYALAIPALSLVVASGQAAEGSCKWLVASDGSHVRDSQGDCVRTSTWTPENLPVECGGKVAEVAPPPPPPPPPPVVKHYTLAAEALFDFDKYNLKPSGKAKLDELVSEIRRNDVSVISVTATGHTDSIGTEAYNQKLSERRANTVARYLEDHGISNVTAVGRGESQPVASNATKEGRAQNRRVEVDVTVQGPQQ